MIYVILLINLLGMVFSGISIKTSLDVGDGNYLIYVVLLMLNSMFFFQNLEKLLDE